MPKGLRKHKYVTTFQGDTIAPHQFVLPRPRPDSVNAVARPAPVSVQPKKRGMDGKTKAAVGVAAAAAGLMAVGKGMEAYKNFKQGRLDRAFDQELSNNYQNYLAARGRSEEAVDRWNRVQEFMGKGDPFLETSTSDAMQTRQWFAPETPARTPTWHDAESDMWYDAISE